MIRYKLYKPSRDFSDFLEIFQNSYPDEDFLDSMDCYEKNDKIYCMFKDDELIGYGAYQWFGDGVSWISIITVKESYRGNGYGKKIVNYLINKLKKKKANIISLHTDIKDFYEKFGFEVYKDWGEDSVETRYAMDLKF